MLDFLNPWMLAGLAGLSLPVIAHLLSRRKFDVVSWGAMQFLELSRTTRRRVRLEGLLLLLLRMAMIALIAIALAQPWISGRLAGLFSERPACDLVIVLDSSSSTGWVGDGRTPQRTARAWSRTLLDALTPGDTVGLVDCRDMPESPTELLTRDISRMHTVIEELPAPAASGPLRDSLLKAFRLTSAGMNLSRHIVVVTDGQARAWQGIDEHFQRQLDELRQQATVPADLWVVNTRAQQPTPVNHSVGRIELSRDVTVVDFPIRVRTVIRNSGGKEMATRRAHLEIDSVRLAGQSRTVRVPPGGEVQVEFEHRFDLAGCHRVAVVIDSDDLPEDDRSDAVVEVAAALPVLLIDGRPHADPTRSETFFARLALSPPGYPTPWVAARVIPVTDFHANALADAQVVVMANVASLTDSQTRALTDFVADGGGLAITLGDQIRPEWYNRTLAADGTGLLPASLGAFSKAPPASGSEGNRSDPVRPGSSGPAASRPAAESPVTDDPIVISPVADSPAADNPVTDNPVTIDSESLTLPWIRRFQAGSGDGFLSARFSNWYQLIPARSEPGRDADRDSAARTSGPETPHAPGRSDAVVAARLTNGEPLIVVRKFGRGEVAVFGSTLDADWSTLPARPAYVAFLHELIFQLASSRRPRNLDVGQPIVLPIPRSETAADWIALSPRGEPLPVALAGNELRPLLRVDDTSTPGIYRLRHRDSDQQRDTPVAPSEELFALNADRAESDLTPLSAERWAELTSDNRFRRIESPDDLLGTVREESARVEIWFGLLLLFVAFLVGEILLTRQLVQGGHACGTDPSGAGLPEAAPAETDPAKPV